MTFAIFCRGHQPPLVEQSNRLVGGVGNVLAGAAAAGRNNYQSHDTLGGRPHSPLARVPQAPEFAGCPRIELIGAEELLIL